MLSEWSASEQPRGRTVRQTATRGSLCQTGDSGTAGGLISVFSCTACPSLPPVHSGWLACALLKVCLPGPLSPAVPQGPPRNQHRDLQITPWANVFLNKPKNQQLLNGALEAASSRGQQNGADPASARSSELCVLGPWLLSAAPSPSVLGTRDPCPRSEMEEEEF